MRRTVPGRDGLLPPFGVLAAGGTQFSDAPFQAQQEIRRPASLSRQRRSSARASATRATICP
ncbi:hypothetical protein AB0D04_38215 [Streptomyces sp. NPDC048483]|uniref:hypothetical protein n=1 Tax=Streptomyces sp. NPDC048483 TaxID=3154927 RepID=UPI0034468E34